MIEAMLPPEVACILMSKVTPKTIPHPSRALACGDARGCGQFHPAGRDDWIRRSIYTECATGSLQRTAECAVRSRTVAIPLDGQPAPTQGAWQAIRLTNEQAVLLGAMDVQPGDGAVHCHFTRMRGDPGIRTVAAPAHRDLPWWHRGSFLNRCACVFRDQHQAYIAFHADAKPT